MENPTEVTRAPAKCPATEGTWFQITITLDPKHYRALWWLAEEHHQTIPDLVRDGVIDLLEEEKRGFRQRKFLDKQGTRDTA